MIKTFISEKIEELDKACNDFMATKTRNLPVRTESFVINSGTSYKVFHKNTVFFDERFEKPEEPGLAYNDINIGEETIDAPDTATPAKKPTNKLGSLWLQKDNKTISGNFNDARIVIPEVVEPKIKALQEGDKLEVTMKGDKVLIIKNKFKKTPTHPDWIIMKGGK